MKTFICWLLGLVIVFGGAVQARVLLVPGTASWYADRYYNNSYSYYNNSYCDSYNNYCNYDYLYRDDYQYRYDHAKMYTPRLSYHDGKYDKKYDYKYTYDDGYDQKYYRYDDDRYDDRYYYNNNNNDYHYYNDNDTYRYYDRTTPLLSDIPTYIPYTHDNAYYQTTPDKTKVVRLDYYYDRYGNPYIMKYDY